MGEWTEDGRTFEVKDQSKFKVLVRAVFKGTSVELAHACFKRQLHVYCFRRGADVRRFSHPSFLKERPDLDAWIKRIPAARRMRAHEAERPSTPFRMMHEFGDLGALVDACEEMWCAPPREEEELLTF